MSKATLPKRFKCAGCDKLTILSESDIADRRASSKDCWYCNGPDLLVEEDCHPFQVGDGVHWSFNGDSYPGTVRKVSKSGREVWVSSDDHVATQKEKDYVAQHGVHEGPIDSIFVPQDVPESHWHKFRFMNNKRKRNVFSDGTFSLCHGREFAYNPHF